MEKSQTIFRIQKRENPFVMVSKNLINDNRLNWKTKGLLIYLLSKPDNWKVNLTDLIKHAVDGRDSVMSAIKQAEKFGYLKYTKQQKDEQGRFIEVEICVYEEPCNGKSVTEKPLRKNRNGKSTTTNNNITNNDFTDIVSVEEKPTQELTQIGIDGVVTEIMCNECKKECLVLTNKILKCPLCKSTYDFDVTPKRKGKIEERKDSTVIKEYFLEKYESKYSQPYIIDNYGKFFTAINKHLKIFDTNGHRGDAVGYFKRLIDVFFDSEKEWHVDSIHSFYVMIKDINWLMEKAKGSGAGKPRFVEVLS